MTDPSGIKDSLTWLQAASWIVAILTPIGTLIFYMGVTGQKLKNIQNTIKDFTNRSDECRRDRMKNEDELHGRCTENVERISRLEGKLNGFHGSQS